MTGDRLNQLVLLQPGQNRRQFVPWQAGSARYLRRRQAVRRSRMTFNSSSRPKNMAGSVTRPPAE
jgi:hypothetical protein